MADHDRIEYDPADELPDRPREVRLYNSPTYDVFDPNDFMESVEQTIARKLAKKFPFD